MSNLEEHPAELPVTPEPPAGGPVEILEARLVPLGGPRAIEVRRTLPQRSRSTIGAWCFADHYGPVQLGERAGMDVPPHPHTGLQTVSWLFEGEIEHRDSVGSSSLVRPGELNLMTAGNGISHSEVSTGAAPVLHGVQLWVALPEEARTTEPFFEHHHSVRVERPGLVVHVFVGGMLGVAVPASVFTPLVAAQIDLGPDASVELPREPGWEYGVLVDSGPIGVQGAWVEPPHLAYLPPSGDALALTAGPEGGRVVLLGGEPFGEQLVMWWNFVGRSHDDIAAARERWQSDVIDGRDSDGPFGIVPGYPGRPLPAPELPSVRLRPRGRV
ncbi:MULTISPECIES: pirin family protein [unclassified Rathayibacter]|uniref:pirin family protein n=1 Tax=unclassified Rathayibacter TaxID=2609250 RepID=UPI00188D7842|nr:MULTISPECIES: pirin family protein [unclassified Rathayibacter]MBF4463183.1 pirin family protein [Rathayibacter sp. VKM Ac-2879]MBF4504580.1 pirin family protein [Rathayibacter sp. VKM Ac-2878]